MYKNIKEALAQNTAIAYTTLNVRHTTEYREVINQLKEEGYTVEEYFGHIVVK